MVGAWFPAAGNAPRVGLRQFFSGRWCTGRGGPLGFFSTSTATFNLPVVRGSTRVGGDDPHEPGRVMVGAWFLAGNTPRVGLRQFFSGRCCTGRGGAFVFSSTSTTTFNLPVVRGMTGVVVGDGISKKYDSLENKKTSLVGFGENQNEIF